MQRRLMSGRTPRLLAAICTLLCLSNAEASEPLEQLAHDPVWLNLGHYRPDLLGGYTSQADDDAFFLSAEGKDSPLAELKATLTAIQAPGTGDDHARCRFPARDQWLRTRLDMPAPPADCPAYETWRDELNTKTVTLVFAASYLNSPSSMFGHTFLRLDPADTRDRDADLLLASTVSYAADASAHDSEIMFAYRGIFGGYPGITSVKPYYEKIKLYSDIENRDLWEYRLNLTPEETDRLLAHAWEIRDKNFDYYFFDENCAYRLLALIDVARPGTQLLGEVNTHAIPSDTVRWVVDHDLVASVNYRPSSATVVAHYLEQLSPEERDLAADLAEGSRTVDSPEVQALPDEDRAHVLDATYDYVRYEAHEEEWPRDRAAPLSYDLLKARSQIDDAEPLKQPPEPAVRDDQGHDTFRASVAGGRQGDRNFVQLTLRPAYHDVLDPPEGYRQGAQLQFLRLDTRYYTDKDELQLEKLIGVEIRSLSVRDRFFTPLSWQVGFGARRTDIESGNRVLTPYLDGGAGFGWATSDQSQIYAMGTGDLEIDDDLDKGYDLAPGADLGWLYQGHRVSVTGGVKSKAWLIGDGDREDIAYASLGWHLERNIGLSAGWERKHHFERYDTTWQIGFNAYF